MAVSPTAGSEVAVNPSANPVGGAGQAGVSFGIPSSGSASVVLGGNAPEVATDPMTLAFLGVVSAVNTLTTTLGSNLLVAQPGRVLRLSVREGLVGPAIIQMAQILESFPSVVTRATPTSLRLDASQAQAMQQAVSAVEGLLGRIQYTRRVTLGHGWKDTRDSYVIASRDAESNATLDKALVPMTELFTKTPRDEKAASDAGVTAMKATKANKKSAKATSTAQAAAARNEELNPSAPQPSSTAPAATSGTPGTTPHS